MSPKIIKAFLPFAIIGTGFLFFQKKELSKIPKEEVKSYTVIKTSEPTPFASLEPTATAESSSPTPLPTPSPSSTPSPTAKPTTKPTPTAFTSPAPSAQASTPSPNGPWSCDCSKSCSKISSCEEADYQLKTCGCNARDNDGDGVACDGKPLNCQK